MDFDESLLPPELRFLFAAIRRARDDIRGCPARLVRPAGGGDRKRFERARKKFERNRRKKRARDEAWAWIFLPTGLEEELRVLNLNDKFDIHLIRRLARKDMNRSEKTIP